MTFQLARHASVYVSVYGGKQVISYSMRPWLLHINVYYCNLLSKALEELVGTQTNSVGGLSSFIL